MTTGISIAGCLLFIFAGSICEWYMKTNINNNKSARFYALNLGIFGFVILQCSLITCSDTITNVLVQSNKFEGFAELWVFRWKTIGRVAGYVLASLDIFETYTLRVYYTVGDNLTFSYACWMVLQIFLLCGLLPLIQPAQNKIENDENLIPSWKLIWEIPFKIKALILSYFFAYGNILVISIYATSWTNISLFANTAQGAKFVVRRRDFDLGVSWGALDMLILSLTSFIFSLFYSFVPSEKSLWIGSNLLSSASLMLSLYYSQDSYTFLFLPLCSCLFICICVTPQRLFSQFDKKFTKICPVYSFPHCGQKCKGDDEVFHIPPNCINQWENILHFFEDLSTLMALCFIPLGFMAFDKFQDSRWALEISSYLGLLSVLASLFI